MNNACTVGIALSVISLLCPLWCCGDTASGDGFSDSCRMLWSSTNFWLVSKSGFDAAVSSGVEALTSVPSERSLSELERWYGSVVDLPLPSYDNQTAEYFVWLDRKVQTVSSYARIFANPRFTNSWIKVAALSSEVNAHRRPAETIVSEAVERSRSDGQINVALSVGANTWLRQEMGRQSQLKFLSEMLSDSVEAEFVEKGCSLMEASVKSNIVSQIRSVLAR